MGVIRVLPEHVANQIAAGEVVERPASVVKELLENALDAGASRISVEIEGGGSDRIRVADDGSGMSAEDARLAFERHATSKIRHAGDLKEIRSLGFRGEALPSIASVSSLTLTTSTGSRTGGTRVRWRSASLLGVEPAPHPRGTTVEVQELFANAPARRKFLRARATESAHIAELLTRVAAAHPAIAFSLSSGGREPTVWPSVASYRERVAQIVGDSDARALLPVDRREGHSRVVGLASKPALHRSTARQELFFVNARAIRDRRLLHAVHQAYATLLPRGRYPLVYLFLEVPLEEVDVNVHPAKTEVRFLRSGAIHDLVRHALLEAHGIARPFYHMTGPSLALAEPPAPPVESGTSRSPLPGEEPRAGDAGAACLRRAHEPPGGGAALPGPDRPAGEMFDLIDVAPLAQFRETYILASSPEGLVIIDQHAAHERVLYEQLESGAASGRVERQRLLFPLNLEVSAPQREIFNQVSGTFEELGFSLQPFGPDILRLDEVPAVIPAEGVASLLRCMLDEVLEWDRAEGAVHLRSRMAATSACHAAVRANHPLGPDEMKRIVLDLMRTRQPMTCPHGRPALLRLPIDRLEREFHRR